MSCCSCWIFPRLLRTKFLFPLAFIVFTQCNKGAGAGAVADVWKGVGHTVAGSGCSTDEGGWSSDNRQSRSQTNTFQSKRLTARRAIAASAATAAATATTTNYNSNNKRDNNKRNSDSHVGGHVLRHGHNKVQAWQAGGVGEGKSCLVWGPTRQLLSCKTKGKP